jgi:hypothetical protein
MRSVTWAVVATFAIGVCAIGCSGGTTPTTASISSKPKTKDQGKSGFAPPKSEPPPVIQP